MNPRKPAAFAREDRLIGLTKPPTKDEIDGCNDPRSPWHQKEVPEFERVWCSACKNTECMRSRGSKAPWVKRMQEQPDYLINDPIFSDLLSHAHRTLAGQDFASRNAQAERLEIADQQQDWSIPAPDAKLPPPLPSAPISPVSMDDPPEELPEELPEEIVPPVAPPPPPPPPPRPRPPANPIKPAKTNTPMPKGGVMIGPSAPEPDPWTPTNRGTMITPGATVVLK